MNCYFLTITIIIIVVSEAKALEKRSEQIYREGIELLHQNEGN